MNRLWAPWRKAYIRPDRKRKTGCVFCRIAASPSSLDAKNYVLKRTRYNFSVLNLFPYNNGHVLIIPIRHLDSIEKMTDAEKLDWLSLFEETRQAIQKAMTPQGFNMGVNLGSAAGAGIPKHLHLHVVPRWKGDSNFMPVVGKTKVISESLESAHRILSKAYQTSKKAVSRKQKSQI